LLGAALSKKGLNDEARAAFHRAIELDPGAAQYYYNLALVELSEKRYAGATTPLETYLRLSPDSRWLTPILVARTRARAI
jgi:Flp pilus assembly protein TadD